MRAHPTLISWILAVAAMVAVPAAAADELTARIQRDLVTLGYQPGNTTGEVTTDTTIAISKFQAEHGLAVTGDVSPQLAGILAAEVDKARVTPAAQPAVAAATPAAPVQAPQVSAPTTADLQSARETCLQRKAEEAQQKQKTRRAIGSLLNVVSRTTYRYGSPEVSRTVHDVYQADATARDISQAAKDLGVSESDIESCKNPG